MADMLNVIVGILEKDPILSANVIGERTCLVSTNMISIKTEESGRLSVPLVAKDTAAKELQRYKCGDEIQFIGVLTLANKRKDAVNFFIPGYLILQIDHERELGSIQEDFIQNFL